MSNVFARRVIFQGKCTPNATRQPVRRYVFVLRVGRFRTGNTSLSLAVLVRVSRHPEKFVIYLLRTGVEHSSAR